MYRPLFHLSSFLQHVLRVACDADAAVMICEPPHTFDELPQQARHCVREEAQGGAEGSQARSDPGWRAILRCCQ